MAPLEDPVPPEAGRAHRDPAAADTLRPRRMVDHALRRNAVLAALQRGESSLAAECDADAYLLRAAEFHGTETTTRCPVCRKESLSEVSWVFGDDLGAVSGSARSEAELRNLAARHDEFTVHVVEVCRSCAWNFLRLSFEIGLPEGSGRAVRRRERARRTGG